jgi:hypothetical protein
MLLRSIHSRIVVWLTASMRRVERSSSTVYGRSRVSAISAPSVPVKMPVSWPLMSRRIWSGVFDTNVVAEAVPSAGAVVAVGVEELTRPEKPLVASPTKAT